MRAKTALWTPGFVLLCALNFFNFGGMWMLPAMLPVYIHNLGAPAWALGWVAGLTSVATIISRPLAGYLVDRYGRRGVFTVGTLGMILTCVVFALLPLVGAILAVRFVQGLAWGLTNTACTTIAADAIPKPRYAEGMGYFALASSVAMIITPALSLAVFNSFGGHASVLICAGLFAMSLLCSCFLVYKKMPVREDAAGQPARQDAAMPLSARAAAFIKDTLLERSALGVALLMLLTASSYGLVQTFLPALLDGGSVGDAGLFFAVMAVAAIAARPLLGVWADRRNYFEPGLAAFFAMTASLLLIMWNLNIATLLAAAALHGIGYSAGFTLFMALATHKMADPSRRGAAIATVMVGFDVGAGITAILFGFVAGATGFSAIFGFGAVIAAFGMAWMVVKRRQFS